MDWKTRLLLAGPVMMLAFPGLAYAKTAAVAPFVANNVGANLAANVTALVSSEMDFMTDYEGAQELSAAPGMNQWCLDNAGCMVTIGRQAGVDHLLGGMVSPSGSDQIEIYMSLVDVNTGAFVRKQKFKVSASPEAMADSMGSFLAAMVTGASHEQAAAATASASSDEFDPFAEEDDDFSFGGAAGAAGAAAVSHTVGTPGNSRRVLDDFEDEELARQEAEERQRFAEETARKEAEIEARRRDEDAARQAAKDAERRRQEEAARAAADEERRREEAAAAVAAEAERRRQEEQARIAAEAERRRQEEAARIAAAQEEERRRQEAALAAAREEERRRNEAAAAAAAATAAQEASRRRQEEQALAAADERRRQEAAAAYTASQYSSEEITFGTVSPEDIEVEDIEFGSAVGLIDVGEVYEEPYEDSARTASYSGGSDTYTPSTYSGRSSSRTTSDFEEPSTPSRSRSSYDEDDEEDRSTTSSRTRSESYYEDLDDLDEPVITSREEKESRSSRSAGSATTSRSSSAKVDPVESGRSPLTLTARGGYSNFQGLDFVSYGGEVGIPLTTSMYLKMGMEAFAVKREIPITQQTIGGALYTWETILPIGFGLYYQRTATNIRPYVGGDLTITPYTADFKVAPGLRVRGGADFMIVQNFGLNLNMGAGFWYGTDFDRIESGMAQTGIVAQVSAGTVLAF